MKYMIISDLHLGDGSNADDFGNNDDKLIKLIKKENPDKLILNGDIFECWQFKMRKIEIAHKKIIDFFNSIDTIYIKGNHDYSLFGRLEYVINTDQKKILITHGFQNDPLMTNRFIRFGVYLVGLVERIFPNIDNIFSKSKQDSNIEKNAMKYAKTKLKKYDQVILGHTHKAGKFLDKKYINDGSCIDGKFDYHIITTSLTNMSFIRY